MIEKLIRRAGAFAAVAAGTWLVLALVVYFLLNRAIDDIYRHTARSILQAECGRIVPGPLIYTLTPGDCRFANVEFDTLVQVDADGFRNTPRHSGSGPVKIAVIGDSHAMGWGVAQADKLSSLLARDPRFTVRDLAMSSYGTPRELLALRQYAGDADVVVLQYCENDRPENAAFVRDPVAFSAGETARAQAYTAEFAQMKEAVTRWPAAHALLNRALGAMAATWRMLWLPPRSQRETSAAVIAIEARLFAGVLSHFKTDLAGKTVIVYDVFARSTRVGFAPAFRAALATAGLDKVVVLDLAGTITPSDFFHIDEHMHARGHAKIAARVLAELDQPERLPVRK